MTKTVEVLVEMADASESQPCPRRVFYSRRAPTRIGVGEVVRPGERLLTMPSSGCAGKEAVKKTGRG